LQLGLDNRNANNKIECTRSTNSTASGTIKLCNSLNCLSDKKQHTDLYFMSLK